MRDSAYRQLSTRAARAEVAGWPGEADGHADQAGDVKAAIGSAAAIGSPWVSVETGAASSRRASRGVGGSSQRAEGLVE